MDSNPQEPHKLETEIVTSQEGTFMILSGDLLGGHIKRGDPWEPHFTKLVKATVAPGAQVIDVGANFGLNTVVLANTVGPSGVVVAIEPLRVVFQQLCGNCFLNGLSNILTLNAAVGASSGIAEMNPVNYFARGWNFGDSSVGKGGERVQMITLDSLGLSQVSFIKIDAQGSEFEILQGARQTIFTARPVIFIEIEEVQLQNRGSSGQQVLECLKSLGYLAIHIQNDYPVDYVCLPIEKKEELGKFLELIDAPTNVIE
jgi:FkbM family methyltransferase